MILDSLIYQEKYPLIDSQMSNSNIGARKHRNIRDHLFIVYAVINSVINGKAEPVDIQIYDVEKCFDGLWLKDCMLDLCENLPQNERDDKMSLLYRMNSENQIAINTAVGQTERVNMPEIVMQGGKGSLQIKKCHRKWKKHKKSKSPKFKIWGGGGRMEAIFSFFSPNINVDFKCFN